MWCCLLQFQDNLDCRHYFRVVLEPKVLPLTHATPHSIFQQEAGQCIATYGEDCASLLQRMMDFTASLACTFTSYVTQWTYLGYGWSTTCSSCTSSNHSWGFVESHTNCKDRASPGIYWGPLWIHAMMLRGSDCSTWRLHAILKSHNHRSCTLL